MELKQWLKAEDGRAAAVAIYFNVSRSAVSQWMANGVPLNKMKVLRDFTGGAVTLEEMVPEPKTEAVAKVA